MNHSSNRYDDSPDSWPIRSSCGGGCGGGMSRMGVSQMPQRWDESWQPDYVPRAPATPRMPMPRFYPDEQPDAVSPVFSRSGVERLVPPRYDDSPDSPHFYEPRIPQTMQPPGMPMPHRPWDDGPDSPSFYGQPVPPVVQPSGMLRSWDDSPDAPTFYAPPIPQVMQSPGMPMQQRLWDDGPDTDNFYRPSSRNQLEMGRSVFQPWEEQPDAPNFSSQRMVETRQVPRFKPWDDGPDTDNFYRPDSSSLQEMPAVTTRPWDDGPDTEHFYRGSRNVPNALPFVPPINMKRDLQQLQIVNERPKTRDDNPDKFRGVEKTNATYIITPTLVDNKKNNWRNHFFFQKDPLLARGAFYGGANAETIHHPALGDKNPNPNTCSAWLLGGNILITAAHCRRPQPTITWDQESNSNCPNRNQLMSSVQPVDFWFIPGRSPQRENYIKNRLFDLGFSNDIINWLENPASPTGIRFHSLRFLRCNYFTTYYQQNSGCVDIDVYSCPDFQIPFYSTNLGRIEGSFFLKPSVLYGSLKLIDRPSRVWTQNKRLVYALSVNIANNNPPGDLFAEREILLSPPGPIINHKRRVVFTEEGFGQPYWDDVEIITPPDNHPYVQSGSSGGALMDYMTNRVLGVQRGGTSETRWEIPPKRMYGLESQIRQIPIAASPGMRLHSLARVENTRWLGGIGGTEKTLTCPTGTAAVGLVGSTVKAPGSNTNAMIGNLGLVCMPFDLNYSLEQSYVIAGGSIDTHTYPIYGELFDTYINDFLSTQAPYHQFVDIWSRGDLHRFTQAPIQQSFALCPPRYFLSGIWAFPGSSGSPFNIPTPVIKQVFGIFCRRFDNSFNTFKSLRVPLGMGGDYSPPVQCRSGSVVEGIDIRSGWYTDRFRLKCRRF